jgi:hypothetical protein
MSSSIKAELQKMEVGQDYDVQLTICHPEGRTGVRLMTGQLRKEKVRGNIVEYTLKRTSDYDNEDTVKTTKNSRIFLKYFFYMDGKKVAELFLEGGELYLLAVGENKRRVKVGCSLSIQTGGRATSKSFLF